MWERSAVSASARNCWPSMQPGLLYAYAETKPDASEPAVTFICSFYIDFYISTFYLKNERERFHPLSMGRKGKKEGINSRFHSKKTRLVSAASLPH